MATKAHTEVPGGGKLQFPPFNKETFASQLVWLAIAFIALYLVIARLAIPQVSSSHANGLHYGSCGATIARVPISAIEEAIKVGAKEIVLEQLLESDSAAATDDANRFIAKLDDEGRTFFHERFVRGLTQEGAAKAMNVTRARIKLLEKAQRHDFLEMLRDAGYFVGYEPRAKQPGTAAVRPPSGPQTGSKRWVRR